MPIPVPRLDPGARLADLGITVIHVVDDRVEEPSAVACARTLADDGTARIETPGTGVDAWSASSPIPCHRHCST